MMQPVWLNASLQLVGEARVQKPLTVELTLSNPLPEQLQDCSFTVDAVGLTGGKPITKKYADSIAAECVAIVFFYGFTCIIQFLLGFMYNLM